MTFDERHFDQMQNKISKVRGEIFIFSTILLP